MHNYPDKLEGELLIVDIDHSTTYAKKKTDTDVKIVKIVNVFKEIEVWKENFKALLLSLSAQVLK